MSRTYSSEPEDKLGGVVKLVNTTDFESVGQIGLVGSSPTTSMQNTPARCGNNSTGQVKAARASRTTHPISISSFSCECQGESREPSQERKTGNGSQPTG